MPCPYKFSSQTLYVLIFVKIITLIIFLAVEKTYELKYLPDNIIFMHLRALFSTIEQLMKKKLSCILFIDDDEPTNFLNKLVVEECACTHHVQVVQSGRDALDYLTQKGQFANTNQHFPKPDLIFLDINMPGMDGWEFLESYQNLPASQKANIVMVMLTTSLNPDDEKTASRLAAISGFEHKPLKPEMLERVLKENFPDHF